MEDKVKVLEIMHGLAPGGIESFVLNMYENIDKSNLDIRFAIACHGKQHHEERVVNQGGIIYRTSDLNGIKNIITHFFRLIKLLKKEGPFDVVHSHIDFFNGINLLAAFLAGVPVRISHAHSTNSVGGSSETPSIIVKVYRHTMRFLINMFSTHRLGCSELANEYMYGNIYSKKSKVIYNGINIEKFTEAQCELTRKQLNIDDKKINLISIGRMSEAKNSLFIPKIIDKFKNLTNNIHLYWIGQGPQEKDVKRLIEEYKLEKYITLLGTRKDIPEILSNMDYMIFPSKWEGLGIVLVEAQAANVPCFISDRVPNEANLGLCTTISLEDDEKEWAMKINTYINERSYNSTIDKNKINKFNIKEVVKDIENIYISKNRSLT